jgi:hypothetical protein
MAKLYNLAKVLTSTTGTGTVTLGTAVPGFLSFSAAGVQNGDKVSYAIRDGNNSEHGTGVYSSSGPTLTRSVEKSTNSDSAISLSGAATVQISPRAADFKKSGLGFSGVYLRSHPDDMFGSTRVVLVKADSICMNDGERVDNWGTLTGDFSVVGAGGRESSTLTPSAWYEIFAIRKSSDDTRNLFFHRMKDFLKDQSQELEDGNTSLNAATGPYPYLAQGFKVANAGKLPFIEIYAFKSGSPSGSIYAEIQSDSAGVPSGTVLAKSDLLYIDFVEPTNPHVLRFHFRTKPTLSAGTQYHIVLKSGYTASDTNRLLVRYKGSGNPYANGSFKRYDGSTWSDVAANADMWFRVYVERNDTALTLPSGYDQYCKIGQAYFRSASLLPFVARDNLVTYNNNVQPSPAFVSLFNNADQTQTVPLFENAPNEYYIPWNARIVRIGVEVGYNSLPSSLSLAQVNIRTEASETDLVRPMIGATNTAGLGASQCECTLMFHEDASQRFRWNLFSFDSGTANKQVIIDFRHYIWID